MIKRKLGDWDVSAIGLGTWAIGGEFSADGQPLGWGRVDDKVSIDAIHCALDSGINFFDTADVYGAGHSERILGKALRGRRDNVILASKFGNQFNSETKEITGQCAEPGYIEDAIDASLIRLKTDYLDVTWFHLNDYPVEKAEEVAESLENLVQKGKIRKFGWSTDFVDRAEVFSRYKDCIGFEFDFNVFTPNDMLSFCEQRQCAAVNRGPLAMGLLSGKYSQTTEFAENDIRKHSPDWMTYYIDGKPSPLLLERLARVRSLLKTDNRSLVQGALAWIWGKSPYTIPIPGFRNRQQVLELAEAMSFGPLPSELVSEVKAHCTS